MEKNQVRIKALSKQNIQVEGAHSALTMKQFHDVLNSNSDIKGRLWEDCGKTVERQLEECRGA
jgi:hypothetical protein